VAVARHGQVALRLVKLRVECKYLIGLAVGEHLARSVRVEEEAPV
jgi:hypothetical protein